MAGGDISETITALGYSNDHQELSVFFRLDPAWRKSKTLALG